MVADVVSMRLNMHHSVSGGVKTSLLCSGWSWYVLLALSSTADAEPWRVMVVSIFGCFTSKMRRLLRQLPSGASTITQITLDLGLQHVVKRDWAPWLWERRCRIYLPHSGGLSAGHESAAVVRGMVHYRQRVVYSFLGAPAFLDKTPHELAHIVFREFVGFDNAGVPRWLDEGVASMPKVVAVRNRWS